MTYFKNKNVDYLKFEKEFIDTLNKHAPKKYKSFRGKQKVMSIKCCIENDRIVSENHKIA